VPALYKLRLCARRTRSGFVRAFLIYEEEPGGTFRRAARVAKPGTREVVLPPGRYWLVDATRHSGGTRAVSWEEILLEEHSGRIHATEIQWGPAGCYIPEPLQEIVRQDLLEVLGPEETSRTVLN